MNCKLWRCRLLTYKPLKQLCCSQSLPWLKSHLEQSLLGHRHLPVTDANMHRKMMSLRSFKVNKGQFSKEWDDLVIQNQCEVVHEFSLAETQGNSSRYNILKVNHLTSIACRIICSSDFNWTFSHTLPLGNHPLNDRWNVILPNAHDMCNDSPWVWRHLPFFWGLRKP